ncbi:hypothetical protein NBRC10512_005434 [Rhodotorula toruloides]|uniref:RHTO0S22e01860g1_1 n=2 Tax=Rhodotorula toruloides TaxID=5286 RepID=A0A061BGC9_RHOTO|nr:Sas10p [Rhodotorula toruloides NP11]EMS18942.1 Sas10p [Rhodotorula toruloides NP11]KAJ8291500.1 Something about silencing protein 10 [Rhodotorula toruloides]CDR49041.1 RHTO0S22e01860g1_1 [Rhodotorula toruloides]
MARPKQSGTRKATQYRAKPIERERDFDRAQSRMDRRIETYDDAMMGGDEDEFHLNRDKMLLEDDGRGNGYDDDDVDAPDTIYDLDLPSSASGSPSPSGDEDEEEDDTPRLPRQFKRGRDEDLTKKGRFGHEYDPKQDVVFPSSDEDESDEDEGAGEVDERQLAGADDEDEDEGSKLRKGGADEDDEDEDPHWRADQYHVTRRDPGEADSEDEEALALEEEEVRRLQKKMREKMEGNDFGLDLGVDGVDDVAEGEKEGKRRRIEEEDETVVAAGADKAAKDALSTADMSEPEAIAHLLKTSPETLALVDDFVLTASKIKQVEADLAEVRKGDGQGGEHPALAIMELEHQALTTYLPTLAFYFSLLLSPTPAPQALIERVIARLSSLRGSLATMEELDLTSATYGAGDDDEDDEELDEDEEEEDVPLGRRKARSRSMLASEALDFADALAADEEEDEDSEEEVTDSMLAGLTDAELEELMGQMEPGQGAEELMERVRAKQREKFGDGFGQEDGMDVDEDDEEELERERVQKAKTKAKGKASSKKAVPAIPELAPLSASSASSSLSRPTIRATADSDFLDPLSLSHADRADKASKRHTLRFHASQVEQKAQRREARRRGLEGDDDVPRRSKEQARREVLKKQQHGAAKDAEKGVGLDEGDFDEDDRRAAKAVREERDDNGGEDGGDDDYYDLVAAEKAEGRKAKKARYDDARAAEKEELQALADASVDGPRAASRKILSNRGLTPKRNKLNRNARVKKRHQYDQKQKKLRSMQATYKGGEARTGYEGERTGISRTNVRSRKLG